MILERIMRSSRSAKAIAAAVIISVAGVPVAIAFDGPGVSQPRRAPQRRAAPARRAAPQARPARVAPRPLAAPRVAAPPAAEAPPVAPPAPVVTAPVVTAPAAPAYTAPPAPVMASAPATTAPVKAASKKINWLWGLLAAAVIGGGVVFAADNDSDAPASP